METVIKQEKLTAFDRVVCRGMVPLLYLGIKYRSWRLMDMWHRAFECIVERHNKGIQYETVDIDFKDLKVITFFA